ncbi:6224_t:CDS:2 [Diversispora eburnea]|uniref:6224_t:CDS:1 n=1 Tax=Diversispora eburnea TaxID=1213867 RepID=A0A9N8V2M3_9GLOM|nr:6224_t:CDS:2 [Diversispora eburnea]
MITLTLERLTAELAELTVQKLKLLYVLAESVTLDEYERHTDKFNIHSLWKWKDYKVVIYELPLKPHETCIAAITLEMVEKFFPVKGTNARIVGLGATRTRADDSGKEADASFHPMKPRAPAPTGSDRKSEPWPNIIIEVSHSESINHVFEKVKNYWLKDYSRVHDAIVVKIDPVSEDEPLSRLQVWHFCSRDRTRGELQHRTHFEFCTRDEAGNLLNIPRGVCLINIYLDCLYYQAFPDIQIPRNILPDPIKMSLNTDKDKSYLRSKLKKISHESEDERVEKIIKRIDNRLAPKYPQRPGKNWDRAQTPK